MVLNLILWPFNTVSFSCYSDPQPRIILLIFHNYNFATVKNCNINIWHGISKRIRTHRLRTTTLDLLPLSVLALSITYLALLVPEKLLAAYSRNHHLRQINFQRGRMLHVGWILEKSSFGGSTSWTQVTCYTQYDLWGLRKKASMGEQGELPFQSWWGQPFWLLPFCRLHSGHQFPTKPNLLDIGFPK